METGGKCSRVARQRLTKKYRNTGDNPEDCPVCLIGFDDIVQRPRTLPCGHTACTLCIKKLNEQGCVVCPECRIIHYVPEGGQFPVCYIVEALIRKLRDTEATASASPPTSVKKRKGTRRVSGQKGKFGSPKNMHSFLQEQEAAVLATITAYQDIQSQLNQYQTALTSWREKQQLLEDRLQELIDWSRSARELVQQEESRAAVKKEEVKEKEEELQATLETYTPTTQETDVAVTEVLRRTSKAEHMDMECQESFPDGNTITTIIKIDEAVIAALQAAQDAQADWETLLVVTAEELWPESDSEELRPQSDPEELDPEEHMSQSDLHSTIMGRLQLILKPILKGEDLRSIALPTKKLVEADQVSAVQQAQGQGRHDRIHPDDSRLHNQEQAPPPGAETLQEPLQVRDLRRMTLPLRSLLEAGRVFGVHQVEGQRRHGRINLEDGELYLYALKEHHSLPGAPTLQICEIVMPSSLFMVFLDLSWPGRTQQRIHIRLSPDTQRGRQFGLLCTGQLGPSYANTKLFGVWDKGRPGEWVCGGDYECNDGRGGAALLPDLDEGAYWSSRRAGAVFGWGGSGSQFGIITRDRQDDDLDTFVFGEVVDGLHVLARAAQHSNIKTLTIVDCGVVL